MEIIIKLVVSLFLFHPFVANTQIKKNIKPNILWITIEDTSPQFIGVNGNADARTSNIDALAKTGICFTTFFQVSRKNTPGCFLSIQI